MSMGYRRQNEAGAGHAQSDQQVQEKNSPTPPPIAPETGPARGLPRHGHRHFDFANGEPSLVFVETDYTIQEVSSRADVKSYVEAFGRACEAALEPRDTVFYLKTIADQLE